MRNILLYFKCLYYNKILTLGYVILICNYFINNTILLYIGLFAIGVCKLGYDTIIVYKRTKNILQHKPNYKPKKSRYYCNNVGYEWAINEYIYE